MRSHRRKLLPLCIAASLLTGLSMEAAAIGVGEIHLQSLLGSPLLAEVPLNHLGELDASQLKVEIGSQGDYGAMGVDYSYLHSQLKLEPIIKNGRGYVRITTREPIAEPYLNFVLSLRWPQGQLVREFTVLLDPPTQAVAVAAMPAADAALAATAAPVAEIEVSAAKRSAPAQRHPRAETAAAAMPGEGSYTIRRGDSLWRIANNIRSAQVPVEQVMTAIQTLNPSAFINGNPNLLKEAVTIALPDSAQIAAAAGTANPAVTAPSVAGVADQPTTTAMAAQPAPAAETPAVVQLVEENSALKTQVADLTGSVAALNQNLEQSEQRLHQLESQLSELIKQMQQQRATMAALSGTTEPQGATVVQSAGSVINQVNASELRSAPAAHTPWWVHLMYWLGIGGAVTWAVREHFWPQRRLATAAVGAVAPVGYEDNLEPATTMARTVTRVPSEINTIKDAVELSLDMDELPAGQSVEPAPQLLAAGEEAVDVSISAGVFVAFGRYGEAERLLREALTREPARTDLKLQLLDVLMQSDQPGAFDDLAAEIENAALTSEELAELAVLRDSYRARH